MTDTTDRDAAPAAAVAGLDIECERALLGELATRTLPPDDTRTRGFTEGFRTGWASRGAPPAAPREGERRELQAALRVLYRAYRRRDALTFADCERIERLLGDE